jgi:hypothetical protein
MSLWELPSRWDRWVAFWDQREDPLALAVTRVCLGVVILFDFAQIAQLDLVVALLGTQEAGGLSDAALRADRPLWYDVFPPTAASAWILYAAMMATATAFTVGFFTRTSALLLMFLWAQQAQILPPSDRGIDMLCRDLLCIFACSGAGLAWGVDGAIAARRQGSWPHSVPAWPRYLMIAQLVVMYWTAGLQKVGLEWTPMGDFAALYVIMQDPAVSKANFSWLARPPFYTLTQLATAVTMVWQWSYPAVLLLYWYDFGPDRGGRLRAFSRRWHPKWVWIGLGAFFHLQLAATLELGIFPWAMMAAYPAFFHPTELRRLAERVRGGRVATAETP